MNFIEKIQNKPREQKIRIIWITIILTSILLMVIWILTSRIGKIEKRDTGLFQTIGNGFKDIKNNYRNK